MASPRVFSFVANLYLRTEDGMLPWKRHETTWRALFGVRTSLSDEDFLSGEPPISHSAVVLVLRRALGELCGVKPGLVHPRDRMGELSQAMGAGGFLGWVVDLSHGCLDTMEFDELVRKAIESVIGESPKIGSIASCVIRVEKKEKSWRGLACRSWCHLVAKEMSSSSRVQKYCQLLKEAGENHTH